jgi:predicted MFS family arabinose efflux permease
MGFFHHHPSIFALGLCLFFTAFNVLEAGLPSLITQIVGKDLRGTTMGVYSSLQFLGLFLGGFLGGFLDNYYGLSAILLLCFILALIWFIICWLLF